MFLRIKCTHLEWGCFPSVLFMLNSNPFAGGRNDSKNAELPTAGEWQCCLGGEGRAAPLEVPLSCAVAGGLGQQG